MTKRNVDQKTRRAILRASLAVIGGVAVDAAQAQDKAPQSAVQYQETPRNNQMCSLCVNFQPPNACKVVAGTINPNGWCIAFAPKST
jgi:hypothetical protein